MQDHNSRKFIPDSPSPFSMRTIVEFDRQNNLSRVNINPSRILRKKL